ncbi:uncharacterized protein MELLADRAFT_93520 [Melampsora larici-populina 98AG31]|uniref:Protein-serine/threonine kinase n=1 Tax=Melampsora larici-populina (strain 98AG31 / pathotype 3-4-7) TaxID=747676 RepID=F4RAQ1_MELLP|nr:uncharacterized protein MELLADRAFT_93520 [Melampsora larici-populina 98AG31]EGG10521.1 hypothetical protein MELLADRAFT_93520 [Melampsora larici-populina 98AG31]
MSILHIFLTRVSLSMDPMKIPAKHHPKSNQNHKLQAQKNSITPSNVPIQIHIVSSPTNINETDDFPPSVNQKELFSFSHLVEGDKNQYRLTGLIKTGGLAGKVGEQIKHKKEGDEGALEDEGKQVQYARLRIGLPSSSIFAQFFGGSLDALMKLSPRLSIENLRKSSTINKANGRFYTNNHIFQSNEIESGLEHQKRLVRGANFMRLYPPITDQQDNQRWCEFLEDLLNQHRIGIPQLAIGIAESSNCLTSHQINPFMTRMLQSRISRRVFVKHSTTLMKPRKDRYNQMVE